MIILDCGYVVMNMNKYLELKFPRKEGNVVVDSYAFSSTFIYLLSTLDAN